MNLKSIVLCYVLLVGNSFSVSAATIYVDQVSGDDNNNGLTPTSAVATFTKGAALVNDGDTLRVGSGTYSNSSGESFPVLLSSSINLSGTGPGQTILDGEMLVRVLDISGSQTVASIDNLGIINGVESIGGGVSVTSIAKLNLSDCGFSNNAAQIGGGIIVYDTPEINVTNCHFENNAATIGAGMQIQINTNIDVLMKVNQSAFSNHDGESIQFQENGQGDHTLQVDQSMFINNIDVGLSYSRVGGQSLGFVSNSLFIGNQSTALFMPNSNVDVVNVTFVDNNQALAAGSQARIVNSIFWDNNVNMTGTGAQVSFSVIENLDIDQHIDAGNNMDVDPLLDTNYRLTLNSPAIDMGSDQLVDQLGLAQDIDHEPRKLNYFGLNRPEGVVDIGADEIPDLIFADGFEN